MPTPVALADLAFPVLLWRSGYSYVANDEMELCTHPRSLYPETRSRALAGEFKLADSQGGLWVVTDFERVPVFGGWKAIPHVILRSVFAVPARRAASAEETHTFCHVIARAVRPRFGKAFAARIENAASAEEALQLLAARDSVSG